MNEHDLSAGQGLGPIQQWEIPEIVEAADSFLRDGSEAVSHELQTETPVEFPATPLSEPLPWDVGSGLIEEGVFLPVDGEAPTYAQEIWSSWFYESLCNRMRSAEAEDKAVSADDVSEFQRQFQRRDLDDDTRTCIARWEDQGHSVDFSLDQVLDRATRRILEGRGAEDEALKDRTSSLVAVIVYNLLQQVMVEFPNS